MNSSPARIGYARVSTADQNLDAQMAALQAARCTMVPMGCVSCVVPKNLFGRHHVVGRNLRGCRGRNRAELRSVAHFAATADNPAILATAHGATRETDGVQYQATRPRAEFQITT